MTKSESLPLLLIAIVATSVAAAATAAEPTSTWTIVAQIEGVDSTRSGSLGCALYDSPIGWPSDRSKAKARVASKGKGKRRTCTFVVDRPGDYAIGAHHDEDEDQVLDKNLFGVPTEGWATSQNVTHTFTGPDFAESKFSVSSPKTVLQLEMHY